MSYDLYCYKSKIGRPDEEEASSIIDDDSDKWTKKERDPAAKLAIVKALTAYNPRLEAFDFDYGEIAKLSATTIGQAKDKFDHIELNPPEDDLAIQVTVYDNHVSFSIPYWYQGEKAKQLFGQLRAYIKIIRDTAGYFIYDPQAGEVFDPAEKEFDGLNTYLSVSGHLDEWVNSTNAVQNSKKPWWKFW